ncbi:hypothetical protein HanRHA438_Chr01g0019091 [Helianthus annuus]|nr:hypothetical protein HanRHA438_Chr01g0019091 [Helianthus annuus]
MKSIIIFDSTRSFFKHRYIAGSGPLTWGNVTKTKRNKINIYLVRIVDPKRWGNVTETKRNKINIYLVRIKSETKQPKKKMFFGRH